MILHDDEKLSRVVTILGCLKFQLWESKLSASRALEPAEPEPVAGTGNLPYQIMQQTSAPTNRESFPSFFFTETLN